MMWGAGGTALFVGSAAVVLAACGGGDPPVFADREAAAAYLDAVDVAWDAGRDRLTGTGGVLPGDLDPLDLAVSGLALELHGLGESLGQMPSITNDLHDAVAVLRPPPELAGAQARLVGTLADGAERTAAFVPLALPALGSGDDVFAIDAALEANTELREAGESYRSANEAVRDAFCAIGEVATANRFDPEFALTCGLEIGDAVPDDRIR